MTDQIKDELGEVEEQEEMQEGVVILQDAEGNDVEFYHIATVDYKEKWYIFLQPIEEMDDIEEDEVLIFELGQDENGDDLFLSIDNEKLIDEVYAEYEKMLSENECDCGDECDCDDECHHNHEKEDCDCKEHTHEHGEGCCCKGKKGE